MNKIIRGTIFLLLFLSGFLATYQVLAIDGDFSNPYADNTQAGQNNDGRSGGNTFRNRDAGLPPTTVLGAVLLPLGIVAAITWRIKEKKPATQG